MRNIFFFIFLVVTLFNSCTPEKIDDSEITVKLNLINSYLEKLNDKNLSKEDAIGFLNKAYALSDVLPDSKAKVEKLQEISYEFYALKSFEDYKKMNIKALKIANNINDSLNIAKSYGLLGIYYRNRKRDSAFKFFDTADKIYSDLDEREFLNSKEYSYDHGKVLIDLAKLSKNVNDFIESENLTIRAIKKFEASEEKDYIPLSYLNLGTIAKYLGRYSDAVNYHKKAIDYAKNTEKEILYDVIGNNNIGTVYKTQGYYDKAETFYKKALENEEYLQNNPKDLALILDNLAYVYFLSGNRSDDKVLDLFNESLRIREEVSDLNGIATNSLHLAEYYSSIGDLEKAGEFAKRAKEVSFAKNNNEELLKSYKLLSDISNDSLALNYAKKYIVLSDSLVNEERAYRDKFARIRYERDEIEQEKEQISKENEFLVIAVLGLTALFLLVYIIFRQQQSNKELLFAQAQQESNEEIYRLLLNQQVKLEEGRQLEQHRMSEELHDGVLGRLFGVRLSLDGLNQRANDGFTEARNKYIEELKAIEKEIRLISHDLGTDTLTPDVAYIDVVESLISDLCDAHKMDFEFKNDENIDWEEIDDQKKVNLLRILQESLQNIFKHAQATKVKISFDYIDHNINLTVLDNGVGFKSSKVKRGIGLKNITNRVGQMSGVVDFISNQDRGTTVHVSVPV